jgi:hypothetical protein
MAEIRVLASKHLTARAVTFSRSAPPARTPLYSLELGDNVRDGRPAR